MCWCAGREGVWLGSSPTGCWCAFDPEKRHFSEEVHHPGIRSQHSWKNEKANIKAPILHLFAALRCPLPKGSVHHLLGQDLARRKETLFHNLPRDNIYMVCTYFRKIFPDITPVNTHDPVKITSVLNIWKPRSTNIYGFLLLGTTPNNDGSKLLLSSEAGKGTLPSLVLLVLPYSQDAVQTHHAVLTTRLSVPGSVAPSDFTVIIIPVLSLWWQGNIFQNLYGFFGTNGTEGWESVLGCALENIHWIANFFNKEPRNRLFLCLFCLKFIFCSWLSMGYCFCSLMVWLNKGALEEQLTQYCTASHLNTTVKRMYQLGSNTWSFGKICK